MRVFVLLFGVGSYLVFFVTLLYEIGFLSGIGVPKAINDGEPTAVWWHAALIDAGLLGLFAIQHTIMARISFKKAWTKVVPEAMERSIFVLLASLLLLLMSWQWRPMPTAVWTVQMPAARAAIMALSFAGWGLVLYASFLIDHFDLFGLRQAWLHFKGVAYTPVQFKETVLYSWVRHPLMFGFLVAFWATPDMTRGHLLFAGVVTAYVLVAIQIEERTLLTLHGEDYQRYRRRVSMLIPWPPKKEAAA